jgi:hypothetical protein
MIKVLVDGATGYLGRYVMQEFKNMVFGFVLWQEIMPGSKAKANILMKNSLVK